MTNPELLRGPYIGIDYAGGVDTTVEAWWNIVDGVLEVVSITHIPTKPEGG